MRWGWEAVMQRLLFSTRPSPRPSPKGKGGDARWLFPLFFPGADAPAVDISARHEAISAVTPRLIAALPRLLFALPPFVQAGRACSGFDRDGHLAEQHLLEKTPGEQEQFVLVRQQFGQFIRA